MLKQNLFKMGWAGENISDLSFVNKNVGIIREVFEWAPEPDDPRIFVAAAIATDTSKLYKNSLPNSSFASGAGLTRKQAIMSACGEAIERYCSAILPSEPFIKGSYRQLKGNAVNPNKFAMYHDEQYRQPGFPYTKFTEDTEVNWVWGFDLINNEPILVPASFVYLPYPKPADEPLIWHSVSTGMAAASSIEEAVLKGICEILERDAFSIVWFNELSMPLIDFKSEPELFKFYQERIHVPGVDYYLLDITLDHPVPIVLGVLLDHQGGLIVAASCNYNLKDACIKTFIELSQGRIPWKQDIIMGADFQYREDYKNINDFHSRVNLFTLAHMKEKVKWLWGSSQKYVPISTDSNLGIKEKLNNILKSLDNKGFQVIAVDLTTEDVRELGIHVVKVIIPGMTEITNDHNIPRIGGERIYKVPVDIGLSKNKRTVLNLNRVPHPFP